MKRIGLLGGMSRESSAEYYRLINDATRAGSAACTPPTA
jgi:aspartate/glutamate racemase